ncbi:SDR family oxidoreductase [Paraliomyxa miuraensis]|uniref:SDR family oxidoreductase n=1 Tax=Paraliomyxa miuraensis TaxID=376150 RepID=UPI0022581BD8|nr:SDR family oxidoreductase [Paraliomyxa miuraensis]MCX4247173.1 SDR family oxidoreductase [Paraliomyxa miuraensis]
MTESTASRRVLITGTSSGFGFSGAKALAERGHTVLATMRGVDGKNRQAADELRAFGEQGGHALHVIELDVSDDASVSTGVARALELGGGIDTVINNAGVAHFGVCETYSSAQVGQLFDVNVVGSFRVAQAVLPHMREAGAGHLVFVGSSLGRLVLPFMGHYVATKFAIEALADSFVLELRPLGIDVTVLQPGSYGTSLVSNWIQPAEAARVETYGPVRDGLAAFGQAFAQMAEAGMIGDPQEIAQAFVRLVELPAGERPPRLTVDHMLGELAGAVNEASQSAQQAMMAKLSMGKG